nr:SOS response-associated peptidase [Novosphingobium aerophilum]
MPEGLTRLALFTLDHVVDQARKGPVRSWAARLALRYLHEHQGLGLDRCQNFWDVVTDSACGQSSEHVANVVRHTLGQKAMHGIYRAMGVNWVEEGSLHYLAVTGRHRSEITDEEKLLNGWAPLEVGYDAWEAADTEQRRWWLWQYSDRLPRIPPQGYGDIMCGRYRDTRSWAEIHDAMREFLGPIKLPTSALNLEHRAEVRPTDPAVIIRPFEDGVEVTRARWWLIPWFHKGTVKEWKFTTFNARAETLHTSRSFRDSFARRRCLISASGWYEWKGAKPPKQKFLFEPLKDEMVMFAGIWDRCETTDQGMVESCTIVTQPAGSPLNEYHDRAPVVLFQDEWARWLDTSADVTDLLGPESPDRFRIQPSE